MRLILILMLTAVSCFADSFRVHYSILGRGKDITVQADSPSEARRLVMDLFPGCVVTNVFRVHQAKR